MEKSNHDIFTEVLKSFPGGRVLDVAAGYGGFIQILESRLKDCKSIIGIDIDKDSLIDARKITQAKHVHFLQSDAGRMALAHNSFNTVTISASLHHILEVQPVLMEMKRVLKPGGYFLLAEMHNAGYSEPQRTFIALHHWAAEVDTALGIPHRPTYSRQELCEFVGEMGLMDVVYYDLSNNNSNPWEKNRLNQIEDFFKRYTQRAKNTPLSFDLQLKGEQLKDRVQKTGIHDEPIVIISGWKS